MSAYLNISLHVVESVIPLKCVSINMSPHGTLNPSLLAQFSSTFANLKGDMNLWGKSIGTMTRYSSGFSTPSRGNASVMP